MVDRNRSSPRRWWALRDRLARILAPFLSKEPAAQLIRQTARQQWRLIALNLGSSLVDAFSEGATLGVVFLAVEVLSTPTRGLNWETKPWLAWLPAVLPWLQQQSATTLFMGLMGLAVLLQALQSLSRYLGQLSVGYFAARCRALVTTQIHSQVLSFSFPCASGYRVGDLTDYVATGPEAIRIQIEQSSGLVLGLLLSAIYLAVLVSISPWLLLAAVLMAGMISLVQKHLLPRIQAGSQALAVAQVAISSRITENFQGLRLLHSTGQLEAAQRRLRSGISELEHHLRGQARRLSVVGPFSTFLPILAIACIAGLSLLLLGGRSSGVLPSLVTFVLALQRLNQRLASLASSANYLSDNSGRLTRLNTILSPVGKQFRCEGANRFSGLEREIRFEAVGLRYSTELPPALEEISFALPKGQMLALVGPSGAGKSSIADLLVGLYGPSAGRIVVDGIPLEDLNLSSWQQRLGVVSQDTFLFNATLAENIAFGTPWASRAQIMAAAEVAQADGFIRSLPAGYDTLVGERGFRLSGGQRQRISLARAILRKPEFLILDEATSALDSQSERLVQDSLQALERQRTVLVIAHRLSTIVHADHILVLEGGRIVERGNHHSLIAAGKLYADLWNQQSKAANMVLPPIG